jgi:hypothetical protein
MIEIAYNLIIALCMFALFSPKIHTENDFKLIGIMLLVAGAAIGIKKGMHELFIIGASLYFIGDAYAAYFRSKNQRTEDSVK